MNYLIRHTHISERKIPLKHSQHQGAGNDKEKSGGQYDFSVYISQVIISRNGIVSQNKAVKSTLHVVEKYILQVHKYRETDTAKDYEEREAHKKKSVTVLREISEGFRVI